MNWIKKLFENKTRSHANKLGLSIRIVKRDLPEFSNFGEFTGTSPGDCICYSLSRNSSFSKTWSLLQRDKNAGAQLSNGYLYQPANLESNLVKTLESIAQDFSEEFFEFEATPEHISVFWDEWGGEPQVERIYKHLKILSTQ